MTLYFLKTILILGIFYMLYLFFLKNNKTFKWNRIYLLISSILALLLPFLNNISLVKKSVIAQPNQPIAITLETINIYASNIQTKELDFAKIVFGIYAVGIIWGLLRMILGFIVIKRIKESSRLEKVENDLIYFNKNIESPFSFNTNIYIPDSFRNTEVLKIILKHEQAHVQLKHSRDKIYFSILQALCWFNPFVYFYHKEIELVHEFEADEFSTQEFTTDDYVENLLKTIQYTQTPTLLAHHFFHHPLKTRITMLYTKSKNALVQKATVIVTGIIICSTLLIIQSYGQKKKGKHVYKLVQKPNDTTMLEDPKTGEMTAVITVRKPDTVYIENPMTGEVNAVLKENKQDTIIPKKKTIEVGINNEDGSFRANVPKEIEIYEHIDEMPEYPGGEDALFKFIQDHLKYPKSAIDSKIQGRVIVNLIVSEIGNVMEVKAIRIPEKGEELGKEAERVIKSMPQWKPGKLKGKRVNVSYSLPITFAL